MLSIKLQHSSYFVILALHNLPTHRNLMPQHGCDANIIFSQTLWYYDEFVICIFIDIINISLGHHSFTTFQVIENNIEFISNRPRLNTMPNFQVMLLCANSTCVASSSYFSRKPKKINILEYI